MFNDEELSDEISRRMKLRYPPMVTRGRWHQPWREYTALSLVCVLALVVIF